jgi:adenylate cyclase
MRLGRRIPRIRLRIGIAVIFLSVMLPLTGTMTGVLYRQNSRLAFDLAQSAMEGATRDVVVGVGSLLGPMARVVSMSVAFGKAERENLRRFDSLRPLLETLEAFPDLYAVYFGFAKDGAFYEVIRLPPPGAPPLVGRKPPPAARYALRIIDKVGDERVDSWIYITKWGEVVGVERPDKVSYDPRPRPWYLAALQTKGVATSSVHVFTSIGRPGLTLSQQLATDDGEVFGVFGADLLTVTLSSFLAERAIGKDGLVFILDEEGRLLGYPNAEKALIQRGGTVDIAKPDEIDDKVTADAVRLRATGSGDHFRAELGASGKPYLVSFSRFPEEFGKNWTIGVIVAESEFVGPLHQASLVILVIGLAFLVLASIGVVWASRLLTRPIQALTAETRRIRALDLSEEVNVRSGVEEIHTLSMALGAMKTALRSFVAYVPKDLVHHIIDSGMATDIGGERRQLTLLFTDLAGFTRTSEFMAPEDVAGRLSIYFESMSEAISRQRGTIDKFIGDSIMALWNAPTPDDDHVANACRAVLACRAVSEGLSFDLTANKFPPMPTRFGLHTGMVVVGNIGSRDRMQYTALGAEVNLASRLEGLNKAFGTTALVSGAVEEVVRDRFLFRPLGLVIPSGMSQPVPLFELLGSLEDGAPFAVSEAEQTRCRRWGNVFGHYGAGAWEQAVEGLHDYLSDYPDDTAAKFMLTRCAAFAAAPPADWDGALRFDGK